MPVYDYKCSSCGKLMGIMRTIVERDNTQGMVCTGCKETNTLQRTVSAPTIGYHTYVNGGGKPPEGFRDVLRKIHANTPGSQIDKTSSYL